MTNMLVKRKIREMLAEDIGFGDITTEALLPPNAMARAVVVAKQLGILAGAAEAAMAFEEVDVLSQALKPEGSPIEPGEVIMKLEGPARGILAAERTALNLLMRMSGIATATNEMLEKARKVNPKIILAATRKVMPLFSYFDKRAVRVGGGDTHRFRLDDCVLIKENHIKLAGDVVDAVRRARKVSFSKKIEVEVSRVEDAVKAAEAGADIIMFDNMEPADVKRAVELLSERGLREDVLLEASGELDPANIMEYAATGVDILSSGYMTLRAPALDMSLEISKSSP